MPPLYSPPLAVIGLVPALPTDGNLVEYGDGSTKEALTLAAFQARDRIVAATPDAELVDVTLSGAGAGETWRAGLHCSISGGGGTVPIAEVSFLAVVHPNRDGLAVLIRQALQLIFDTVGVATLIQGIVEAGSGDGGSYAALIVYTPPPPPPPP